MKNCPETQKICFDEWCEGGECKAFVDTLNKAKEAVEPSKDEGAERYDAEVSNAAGELGTLKKVVALFESDGRAVPDVVAARYAFLQGMAAGIRKRLDDAFDGEEVASVASVVSLKEARDRVENLNAPKVTKASIESRINYVGYHVINVTGTLCTIAMINGFRAIGFSRPASAENYDYEVGKRYAYENAFRDLWRLEGYLLCERLSEEKANEV